MTTQPPFNIGDKVIHSAFTDCFGKHHPDSEVLEVESVQLEECRSIPSYWRIKARGEWAYREGAARGFRVA
jgi:hypothetical protein